MHIFVSNEIHPMHWRKIKYKKHSVAYIYFYKNFLDVCTHRYHFYYVEDMSMCSFSRPKKKIKKIFIRKYAEYV